MKTTFKINTDFLGADLIDNIKKLFPHKEVEIIVQESDATDYIKSNPAFEKELSERINNFQQKQGGIILKSEDLL